jgi:hypothetical protein
MSKLILIFFIVTFSHCGEKLSNSLATSKLPPSIVENKSGKSYRVYRIDSLDNFFLIYAGKNDSNFKIISEKGPELRCRNIYSGGIYQFALHNAKDITINNTTQTLRFYLFNVDCLIYNDTTRICIERGGKFIEGLFIAKNIQGLCYTDNDTL